MGNILKINDPFGFCLAVQQLESLIIGWEALQRLRKALAEGVNINDSCLPEAQRNRVWGWVGAPLKSNVRNMCYNP